MLIPRYIIEILTPRICFSELPPPPVKYITEKQFPLPPIGGGLAQTFI